MRPTLFRVILLLISIFLEATLIVGYLESSPNDDVIEWEFEPREWKYEGKSGETVEDDHISDGSYLQPLGDDDDDPHRQANFAGSNIQLKQQQQECTQYRVDTREAVICDKTRCDKLNFEWPKYDNQLSHVQTTRHGMRFHRVDLAFSSPDQLNPRAKQYEKPVVEQRVKFDIFDLFKPRPGFTTTPQSPSSDPALSSTSTESPPTSSSPSDTNIDDNNTTQLVTTFRLDTRRKRQQIVGFGGALSDSTCRNIKSLSPEMSRSLMEDYYGERGLRYSIVRLTMGSSDFSTTPYTNDDLPVESPAKQFSNNSDEDLEMNMFRLVAEDYDYKIPLARQAIATSRRELKFFSSLWSPPIWMKNNSHIVHGFLKGDVYGPHYKALAEYMIKWMEAYRRNGIELWATTGLNEPITGVKPFIFHNSLGISREDYVTFIKLYLGPMMKQRGFANVKLIILDDNKGYANDFVRRALDDRSASQFVDGIGVHWYMNDEYENIDFLARDYPEKFVISTEACNGYLPFQIHALPGNWDRGIAYALDITRLMNKNVAGWVDWNMALDLSGGPSWAKNLLDAPIIVNSHRDEYYKSPMFYALGHYSRFVEPNSTRIDSRLANAKYDYPFEAVSFLTPNSYIVIIVINANKHQVPFRVIVDRQTVRVVNIRAESLNTIAFKWKTAQQ